MVSTIRSKIFLTRGDITKLAVDAIVNAANSSLLGGGGVDGVIHSEAGPELLEECKQLDGCEVGQAKITDSYEIKGVKKIIHTVGPHIGFDSEVDDEEIQQLGDCYRNSLDLAKKYELRSIAFPCISTGIYNFPKEEACEIALGTVKEWLENEENNSEMEKVIFCVFNEKDEELYGINIPKIIGE